MGEDSDCQVLIVGAGPGGLTAAMMLAKAGVKVTILEKSDDVGVRIRFIENDCYKFPLILIDEGFATSSSVWLECQDNLNSKFLSTSKPT